MGKAYFEGWYFKQQAGGNILALIPGHSMDDWGREEAFIQVIGPDFSRYIRYPAQSYQQSDGPLIVQVGDSFFTQTGIRVNINQPDFQLMGVLDYGRPTPLKTSRYAPDIMGPFSYLPRMQCVHGVVSLGHSVSGSLLLNGKLLCFDGGKGYIESDAGSAFPRRWLWAQCNQFDRDCSVMLAVADVPVLGTRFTGLICAVDVGGEQYRIATYYGGRIAYLDADGREASVRAQQGSLSLELHVTPQKGHELMAPHSGGMERLIRECPSCRMHLRLTRKHEILCDAVGEHAGFECVDMKK